MSNYDYYSNLTCDEELSKELKDLGYPQRGFFCWETIASGKPGQYRGVRTTGYENKPIHLLNPIAPTAEELIWFIAEEEKKIRHAVKKLVIYKVLTLTLPLISNDRGNLAQEIGKYVRNLLKERKEGKCTS